MKQYLYYKRIFAWVFLAGYVLLSAYSAFHFHKIDIGSLSQLYEVENTASSSQTPDKALSSVYTCQFNLVYNSVFVPDCYCSSSFTVSHSEQFVKFNSDYNLPSRYHFLANLLRAPPASFNS